QSPSIFCLGLYDSRAPESLVSYTDIGEVFNNIANFFNPLVTHTAAALAYTFNKLKVNLAVLVGHEFCGGCAAALF
ncbi:hypothetical protein BY996DRAFT_4574247, partial [Phakopsora pachyrhizi]